MGYTRYPYQGDIAEKYIEVIEQFMVFPNREIAVITLHALLSLLGGRVYCTEDGLGIVLNALVTGRSTIGKSNVKNFIQFALNNFQYKACSGDFFGSYYYNGILQFYNDIKQSGNLILVKTESGWNDINARASKNILMYELELATESGPKGYVSSVSGMKSVRPLYSPAVTIIRESVEELQTQFDLELIKAVSGMTGRRSHVKVNPEKKSRNDKVLQDLPDFFKLLLINLYKKISNPKRKNVLKKISPDLWITCKYSDSKYLSDMTDKWIYNENFFYNACDSFLSTFYGRLYERVPAYAARLAILENPDNPVISREYLDIAEMSLTAEAMAIKDLDEIGNKGINITEIREWDIIIKYISYIMNFDLSRPESTGNVKTISFTKYQLRKDGYLKWGTMRNIITNKYKDLVIKLFRPLDQDVLMSILKSKLHRVGIDLINVREHPDLRSRYDMKSGYLLKKMKD